MNRRLRKKKHYGEFTEWGFGIQGGFNPELDANMADEFMDWFLDLIEGMGLSTGGGISPLGGFGPLGFGFEITGGGKRGSVSENQRLQITNAVQNWERVIDLEATKLRDEWHSDAWY